MEAFLFLQLTTPNNGINTGSGELKSIQWKSLAEDLRVVVRFTN